MHFEISKSSLVKALANVNGAVEKRNTIPILLNVKIEAKNNKLLLTATDMDIVVTDIVEAKVKSDGKTTIPAQLFYDIVRKIPDGNNIVVEMQDEGNSVKIKYGKSKFALPCLDSAEFPVLSEGDMTSEFTIKAVELTKIIDKTRFAISNDETRYYLNGLFLHAANNELKSVATDGHRLALAVSKGLKLDADIAGVIVPKKTVNEIRRIVEGEEEIKISLSKTKIKVACKNTIIISKLIDGEFPDYDKVVPKNNDKLVKISKKSLFDAIDRVSTIATDKHRSIKFILENNKISLQVNTADGGFADEEIDVEYNGEKIETGFNSKYLLDIVGQVEKEQMEIKFKDGTSPALVRSEGNDDSLFVIMPVRI